MSLLRVEYGFKLVIGRGLVVCLGISIRGFLLFNNGLVTFLMPKIRLF